MEPKSSQKRLVIVTGLAGAGKSVAVRSLEDLGYACIDNLPSSLLDPFIQNFASQGPTESNVALALDSRDPLNPQKILDCFDQLTQIGTFDVLFLEAQQSVILKRFRETRRLHPLSKSNKLSTTPLTLSQAIELDIRILQGLRARATRVIDTTGMTSDHLRKLVRHDYATPGSETDVLFNIISFGFKYGIPPDVDCIFDVRCFSNPHYVDELKPKTGQSAAVKEFVFADTNIEPFLEKITDLLTFLHPLYQNEGKRYFGIGIGCTGGKHRSVAIGEELALRLKQVMPLVALEHRHMARDSSN